MKPPNECLCSFYSRWLVPDRLVMDLARLSLDPDMGMLVRLSLDRDSRISFGRLKEADILDTEFFLRNYTRLFLQSKHSNVLNVPN